MNCCGLRQEFFRPFQCRFIGGAVEHAGNFGGPLPCFEMTDPRLRPIALDHLLDQKMAMRRAGDLRQVSDDEHLVGLCNTGDPLGYVGDTGNAGAGNTHLHFGVSRMAPGDRWWSGEPVDPYPLLAGRPPRR